MTSSLKEKDDRIQELELKLETELAVLKEYIQELELQLASSAKFYFDLLKQLTLIPSDQSS